METTLYRDTPNGMYCRPSIWGDCAEVIPCMVMVEGGICLGITLAVATLPNQPTYPGTMQTSLPEFIFVRTRSVDCGSQNRGVGMRWSESFARGGYSNPQPQ